jgi:hypothetical protein
METTQDKFKRRSFFKRLLGGIAGGWITGNLFSGIARSTAFFKNSEKVQVTIDPLAVPRINKDAASHGA